MLSEVDLKPCPFCGCELSTYPLSMIFRHATSEDYVQWLRKNSQIVGSDKDQTVRCPRCGALGARGINREDAILKWNLRKDDAT